MLSPHKRRNTNKAGKTKKQVVKFEIIKQEIKGKEKECVVIHKKAKHNEKSFKITQSLLRALINQAEKENKPGKLIITVPANVRQNYIIDCIIKKEDKIYG